MIKNLKLNKNLIALSTNTKCTFKQISFNDNSALNQRIKLLDWLREKNSISSQQARSDLDIYNVPARVFELRQAGYLIETIWDYWTSEYGIKHRIARYVLTHKHQSKNAANCELTE